MSEPLLNVMKVMLLAGLYLFFVRVLWSVYNELRDPRTRVARRASPVPAPARAAQPAPTAPPVPAMAVSPVSTYQPQPTAVPAGVHTLDPVVGQLVIIAPAELAGASYPLGNQLTIGRAEHNGIRLDDSYVSTVHARVFLREGRFYVEDLDSRNGSTLNGHPLTATTRLDPGDQLTIGATVLEFS